VNLVAAVLDCYSCRLPDVPADGVMRRFPIDQFRIGFVVSFGDAHSFGCWSDGDIYYFDGVEWHGFEIEPQRPPKQEFNRMVIACAKGLIARGEELNKSDSDRLRFAVEQVEANS